MWLDADIVARGSYDAVMAGVPVFVPGRVNRAAGDARARAATLARLGADEAEREKFRRV